MNPCSIPMLFIRGLVVACALACLPFESRALERTYSGGGAMTINTSDTISISGAAAAADVELGNGMILSVSDKVTTNAMSNLTGKTDVLFRPASDGTGNKWAVIESTAASARLLQNTGAKPSASGTQTLEFNNVVFKNATFNNHGAAFYYAGGDAADNELLFKGNIAFVNNVTTTAGNGGAISAVGHITFSGTAIFDSNKAGWNNSAFTGALNGGAITYSTASAGTKEQSLTFKSRALFLGNAASGGGGAILNANNTYFTLKFEDSVLFYNNVAMAANNGGGAMSLFGADVIFQGMAEFVDNKAIYNGGALFARVTPVVIENVGYVFSGNQAKANGGGVYIHTSGTMKLNGSGTFINNIAQQNGGAIFTLDDAYVGSGAVFENNRVGNKGGAIYMNGAGKTLTLSAQTDDIWFKGNTQGATMGASADGWLTASGGISNAISFGVSGTLLLDAASGRTIYLDDPVQGAAGTVIVKKGPGSVIFSNTMQGSDIAAAVTVEAGVFAVAENASFGESGATGSFTVKTGATLAGGGLVQSGTMIIQDGAVLEARDSGSLRITSDNPYTTGTNLTLAGQGSIRLDNATTPLHVARVRVGDSSGSAQSQALTVGANDIILGNNAVLQFDLNIGNASDRLDVTNISLVDSAVIDLTWVESGSFTLISWAGSGLTATTGLSLKANGSSLTARNNATLGVSATALYLTNKVYSLGMEWTGADSARIWQSSPVADANWKDNGNTGEKYFNNGDSVTFGEAGQGAVTVVGQVYASEINITGGDYAFTGTGGIRAQSSSVRPDAAIVGSGTSGKLVKSGAGTLEFANTGTNVFEKGIQVNGGVIAYQSASQLQFGAGAGIDFAGSGTLRANASTTEATGTLAAAIQIGAGKTAAFDTQAHDVQYGGIISGQASSVFAKKGSGMLVLEGDMSAFSGTTSVDAGALMLTSAARLAGVTFVKGGATFGGSGSAAVVATEAGSIIQAGRQGAAETLSVGMLNMAADSMLKFNLLSGNANFALSQNSKLEAGTVNLLAGNANMSQYIINISSVLGGVYDLGNIAALANAHVTYGNNLELSGRQGVSFEISGGRLLMKVNAGDNDIMVWTGSASAMWASANNWRDTMPRDISFIDGDLVVFNQYGAYPYRRDIDLNNNVVVADMRVDDAADYRFHGVGGITGNAGYGTLAGGAGVDGKLKKSGAGTLTFENTGSNVFMGGIDISGGAIVFNDGRQLLTTGIGGVDAGIKFIESATLRPVASTTLGGMIDIVAGKRATIDVASPGVALTWYGSFAAASSGTLLKSGSGALVLTGDNAGHAGRVEVAGGSVYLGGAFALLGGAVDVNSGAFFGGVGEATGAVSVAGGATLRVGAPSGAGGKLTLASLTLQNGASLTGSGTLDGAALIGGATGGLVTANIEAGDTLSIIAALAGSGTLAKAGAGSLVYGSDAAFGHAETVINDGILMLRNVTPSNVAHSFVLNGGWLDLSESVGFTGTNAATANDWTGLRLSGETGRVIGKNDVVNLNAAGAYSFQIGGTTVETQGVYVVIAPGTGTVALTGANTYVGRTYVKSGVLAVTEDKNFGDSAMAREVVLAGGNLLILESFNTERSIELASNGAMEVASGKTTRWKGVNGVGTFTKEGAGTLEITGSIGLGTLGTVVVAGGVLQGSASALSARIDNQATVNIILSAGTAAFAGRITGDAGIVNKTGAGALNVTDGSAITASTFNLKEGAMILSNASPFSVRNQFLLAYNTVLRADGGAIIDAPMFINSGTIRIGKAAGNAGYGQLRINGDFSGYGRITLNVLMNENKILNADKLVISGSASGENWVDINIDATTDAGGVDEMQIVRAEQGVDGPFAFQLYKRYVSGAYDLTLTNDGILSTLKTSPELPAVLGLDIAPILIGKASLDSLANRMLTPKLSDLAHGYELWANGLYRHDQLDSDDYDGTDADTTGIQAGADMSWKHGKWALTAGLFCDYAKSTMHMPDGKSSTETASTGAGVYISCARSALYVDAIARFSKENYTIVIPGTPSFETDGSSWAGSVELGYKIKMRGEERVLPYVRIVYQSHDIDAATDSFDRTYTIDGATSLEGRIGVRMWEQFDWGPRCKLIPHFGIAVINEFKGDTEVWMHNPRFSEKFRDNRLNGSGGLFEGGVTLQLNKRCAITADGSWYIAEKLENYTINAGIRYVW